MTGAADRVERDDGDLHVVLDPPDVRWRGVSIEDGEETPIAVALVGGVPSPRFHAGGRWRDPASAFGYRIMSAWAESREHLAAAWERLHRARAVHYTRELYGVDVEGRRAVVAAVLDLAKVGGPDLRAEVPPSWFQDDGQARGGAQDAQDPGTVENRKLLKLGTANGLVYFDGVSPEAYPRDAVALREAELVGVEWRLGRPAQGTGLRPIVGHADGVNLVVPVEVVVTAVHGSESERSALRARRSR